MSWHGFCYLSVDRFPGVLFGALVSEKNSHLKSIIVSKAIQAPKGPLVFKEMGIKYRQVTGEF